MVSQWKQDWTLNDLRYNYYLDRLFWFPSQPYNATYKYFSSMEGSNYEPTYVWSNAMSEGRFEIQINPRVNTPVLYPLVSSTNDAPQLVLYDLDRTGNKYLWIWSYRQGISDTTFAEFRAAPPSGWTTTEKTFQQAQASKSQSGSGKAWRYRLLPNGHKQLSTYDTALYPSQFLTFKYHSYADKSSTTAAAGSYSDTTSRSQTVSNTATIGVTSGGNDYAATSTSTGGYWQQVLTLTEQSYGVDFETVQWGNDLSGNLYSVPEKNYTLARNGTLSSSLTTGPSLSWSDDGYHHTATAATNTTYAITCERELLPTDSFEQSYISSVAGETVYLGGGCPIVESNGDADIKLTIKLKTYNKIKNGSVIGNQVVNYKLSDKQFVKGGFAPGSKHLADSTVTTDSSGEATISMVVSSIGANQLIWITTYASTQPYVVELVDVDAKLKA